MIEYSQICTSIFPDVHCTLHIVQVFSQMCKCSLSESSISLGNPLFALFYAHTQQDWILETGLTMGSYQHFIFYY